MNTNYGKTIRMFLVNGDPNGRVICELSNWTGLGYRIPRTLIKESPERKELHNSGIYLLIGNPEFTDSLPPAYIGEAEDVQSRLEQHLKSPDKDFWTTTIVFISKDNNLNKAHIKYIENRLYEIARESGRYELRNANTPTRSSLSEFDIAEMEEFIDKLRLLTNTMGYKIFEPLVRHTLLSSTPGSKDLTDDMGDNDILYLKASKEGREANARGQRTTEGFVVFKGSSFSSSSKLSFSPSFVNKRNQLKEHEVLTENNGIYSFTKDYIFSSPSTASTFILGRSSNGLIEWKNQSGVSLKELQG